MNARPANEPTTAPTMTPVGVLDCCGRSWRLSAPVALPLGRALGVEVTVCVTIAPETVTTWVLVTGATVSDSLLEVVEEEEDVEDGVGVCTRESQLLFKSL